MLSYQLSPQRPEAVLLWRVGISIKEVILMGIERS